MANRKIRPLEVRIREEQEKMDRLLLRKKIAELRAKLPRRKTKRRS